MTQGLWLARLRRRVPWFFSSQNPRRLTIRTALFVGFWLIFGIWVVSGYSLAGRLAGVEERAWAIHDRFTRNEELLFTVKAQVLLGAVYLRDAVLDTGLSDREHSRNRLQESRRQIEIALQQYVPVVENPSERENWERLRAAIDDYWSMALPVLAWEPIRKATEARSFLRREVIPKRNLIIRVSDLVQVLNRSAFDEKKTEIAKVYREMRARVWWTTGLSVLLALGVAFLVILYAGQLEARIHQQHLQDVENKRDLQQLSARLVHAQEEERRSIARELHDEIGQAFTAIKMELAIAERGMDAGGKARPAIEEARSIADRTLQEVRDLSQVLHPSMLDDLGLPATLLWYLRGFSKRTGIRTELVQDCIEGRLATEVEVSSYRIVQEALTNVARHSGAASCRVYLQRLPHTLLITVEDDGCGFDTGFKDSTVARRGLGLVGIQERVSSLGGVFRLESAPGKGARLTVELPALAAPGRPELAEFAPGSAPVPTDTIG